MSRAALRASLALWTRRHAYRQRRLIAAHQRNDSKAIDKWYALLAHAGVMIRKRRAQLNPPLAPARARIVAAAQQAAANYRKNPGAYHYLAGGIANTVIMAPTPRTYRSDCSQFAVNCYRVAGVPCPGSGTYLYSNTDSINQGGRVTTSPKPGDLGMYGQRGGSTHHVEVYVGNGQHIGHGSPPIDSLIPGLPNYYLTFFDD
jgi:cell wall-associated NlpC family hydrolase